MASTWVQYDLIYYSSRSLEKAKQAFKGCFICIKNDLIEIAPFPWGYFDHFLLAFFPRSYDFRGWLNINVRVGLNAQREAATAKYVGVNKLIRGILIEIAPFHGTP